MILNCTYQLDHQMNLILFFSLENCIRDFKSWMLRNKLHLNDDKTDVVLTLKDIFL